MVVFQGGNGGRRRAGNPTPGVTGAWSTGLGRKLPIWAEKGGRENPSPRKGHGPQIGMAPGAYTANPHRK